MYPVAHVVADYMRIYECDLAANGVVLTISVCRVKLGIWMCVELPDFVHFYAASTFLSSDAFSALAGYQLGGRMGSISAIVTVVSVIFCATAG